MTNSSHKADDYYATAPYKDAFDIGYPQEPAENLKNVYRCKHCKKITTDINGRLENHAEDCAYRLQRTSRSAK